MQVRTLCDYWAPDSTSAAWELVRALELTSSASGQAVAQLVQVCFAFSDWTPAAAI